MPRLKISESEILEELRASIGAGERPAGFLTVQEMSEELDCARGTVERKLSEWEKAGRLESTTIIGLRKDGIRHRVKAYKLKAKR